MPINRKRRRASRFAVALLAASLLSPVAVRVARADADEEKKARTEADAKVNAAQNTIEKISAFYQRARLTGNMEDPDDNDWKMAEADINEAVRLIDEYQKDGKSVVNGKSGVYSEQGYIASNLQKYEEAIAAYDKSEKAGFAKDFAATKNKGSSLWFNRGLMKAKIYDFEGAIADFKASLALFDGADTHKQLASALYQEGDMLDAVAERFRAAALDDDVVGDEPFDADQAPLNKAIFENPGKAAPLIERARYIFKKMRDDKTFAQSDSILDLFGGNANEKRADALAPALKDLDRAVKAEPQAASPLVERGRMRLVYMSLHPGLLYRAFDYDDLQKDFEKAVALDPKNAEAWFESGLARILMVKQESESVLGILNFAEGAKKRQAAMKSARSDFSRAIYLKPDASGEVSFQRATLERQSPHPDANALFIDYSAAIKQNLVPLDAEWHALIRPKAAAPNPTRLSEAHLTRAKILMSRGQLAAALADFDAAIAAQEGNLDARFERGKLRVQRGDYDGALEDLSRVIKDNPKVGEVWLWRAVASDGKGDSVAAKADLKEAIARDAKIADRIKGSRYDEANPNPNRGLAPPPRKEDVKILPPGTALDHKNAGNALLGKNDADGALNEYNLALMIDPNFADSLNNRAGIYLSRGEVDLAMADYNHAIEIDPKHRVAYLNRASAWEALGDTEKQVDDLNHAIEFADNDERRATSYSARALVRYKAKLYADSFADAQKAIELAPKSADAWITLGRLQMATNKNTEAAESFRRVIAQAAGNMEAHVNLSLALALSDDAAAAEEFEQAIKLAEPDQLLPIGNSIERALKRKPDSAALKAMQNRVVKAMQDADADKTDDATDDDPLFLL